MSRQEKAHSVAKQNNPDYETNDVVGPFLIPYYADESYAPATSIVGDVDFTAFRASLKESARQLALFLNTQPSYRLRREFEQYMSAVSLYNFLRHSNYAQYGDKSIIAQIDSGNVQLRQISAGGFGKVYKAFINTMVGKREYYVKKMEHPIENYYMIRREIEANFYFAKMYPRNVSKIVAADIKISPVEKEFKVICRIVYEYLPGMDLFDYFLKVLIPKGDPEVLKQVFCMAKDAVKMMHVDGFVHRDIKPENLFVVTASKEDTTPLRVLVIDLGFVVRPKPGELYGYKGSPDYSPKNETGRLLYGGVPVRRHDEYAMRVAWNNFRVDWHRVYGVDIGREPKCASLEDAMEAAAAAEGGAEAAAAGGAGAGAAAENIEMAGTERTGGAAGGTIGGARRRRKTVRRHRNRSRRRR